MSLEVKVNNILQDFDNVSSDKFLKVIDVIMLEFKSNVTVEYLQGKIKKIKTFACYRNCVANILLKLIFAKNNYLWTF